MSKRYDNAVRLVQEKLAQGAILKAYSGLYHEETTVGPFHYAVPNGTRFAVIGWPSRYGYSIRNPQYDAATAREAAMAFVDRVGEGRARQAAL